MIELLEQRRAARKRVYDRILAAGADPVTVEAFEAVDALDDALTTRIVAELDLLSRKPVDAIASRSVGFVDQHGNPT